MVVSMMFGVSSVDPRLLLHVEYEGSGSQEMAQPTAERMFGSCSRTGENSGRARFAPELLRVRLRDALSIRLTDFVRPPIISA